MAGNRLKGRSRLGFQPEIRDLLKYIETTDTTTSLDVQTSIVLGADNLSISFGNAGTSDAYIKFDGTDLLFFDSDVGTTKKLKDMSGASLTLDNVFDVGKSIDGATNESNALKVGDATNQLKFYGDATDLFIKSSGGDIKFISTGGDVTFDNDNVTTSGTVQGGTITDGTASLASGTLSVVSNITNSGAINIKPSGDTDDYITIQTSGDVPNITTTGSCDLKITASGGDIDFDNENLVTTGTFGCGALTSTTIGCTAITCQGITNTVAPIGSTLAINIGADNVNLTLGASGASDSKVFFDGAGNLTFWDSNLAANVTLSQLASTNFTNPVFTGDVTITDGKITWTDAQNEAAGVFTFANTAAVDIAISSAVTSGDCLSIVANACTSGTILKLQATEAALNLGHYIECYDATGAGNVFTVDEDGVTTISGLSGDALVVTLGNFQMTNGDIDVDDGKITIDTTTDESSYIYRNQGVTTTPVFEIKEDAGAADKECLLITHDPTADIDAMRVVTAGTGYGITVQPAATGGGGYEVITPTGGTAPAFFADGTTNTWVGAAATGMIQAQSDGALANVAASLLYLAYSGNAGGGNQTGSCINVVETGAASGTSYAVGISSTNNNALNVSVGAASKTAINVTCVTAQTGNLVNLDGTTTDGWQGGDGKAVLAITGDGNLAHANASMLNITYSGTAANSALGSCLRIVDSGAAAGAKPAYVGYINTTNNDGLAIVTGLAGAKNLVMTGVNGQVASMAVIDGTTGANGWMGAANVGMLHITTDGALADVATSPVLISSTGTGQNAHMGTSLRIVDTCNAGAGSYAVYISATDADVEAIKVDNGTVVVDETLTATGGIITYASTQLLAAPGVPAKAELGGFAGAAGKIGFLDHNNAHTNCYLVVADGNGDYWYVALTKAV